MTVYKAVSRCFTVFGLAGMLLVPYYRLTGFWENGLRWRFPEKQLDRTDFMSEYLKTSVMKHFYQRPWTFLILMKFSLFLVLLLPFYSAKPILGIVDQG